MSAASVTLRGRAAAVRLMVDTCTITRVVSAATNLDTGVVTYTRVTVYTGPCRFQAPAAAASAPTDVAQAHVYTQQPSLQVPITVTDVQPDDQVAALTAALDPNLVERTWHVRGGSHKTHATKRTFELIEIVG